MKKTLEVDKKNKDLKITTTIKKTQPHVSAKVAATKKVAAAIKQKGKEKAQKKAAKVDPPKGKKSPSTKSATPKKAKVAVIKTKSTKIYKDPKTNKKGVFVTMEEMKMFTKMMRQQMKNKK